MLAPCRERLRPDLHFPHGYRTMNGQPGGTGGKPAPYRQARIGLSLFDLEQDPGEKTDVLKQHPEVVKAMQQLADRIREELGDSTQKKIGSGVRPPGRT